MESVEAIENALEIVIPQSESLAVGECRRLTGPGLLWDHPGAVIQVDTIVIDTARIAGLWRTHARKILDSVGWVDEQIATRPFDGGINLAISAPMDQLYSAVFVAQTVWQYCAADLLSVPSRDLGVVSAELISVMRREQNDALMLLIKAAGQRGLDVLCDDDSVSIGHGTGSQIWPVNALPSPNAIEWQNLHNIPIALITGTNGKTTTTRLCAAIARAGGRVAGLTSTDFVCVGERVLDMGDYSGPGGARLLLRDKELEVAFLEVARGGILRRGLPTRKGRVAVVTNVAADHLGQYGVNTVPELARAKFSVHRALADDGILVLNADDPYVVAEAEHTPADIWWFSMDSDAPHIVQALESRRPCAFLRGKDLCFFDGERITPVIDAGDIPITMSGAARYNVLNALAAVCVSRAMDLDIQAIRTGLSGFKNDPSDNPGRFNEFKVKGARVFVDFAHNPHSVSAVAQTVSALPAQRRIVMLSHAGDRSDQDIRDLTETALTLEPDIVVAAELGDYLRGRALGEVSDLIAQTCQLHGLENARVVRALSPSDGVQQIIDMLKADDVVLLLVLSERDKVFGLLNAHSES